MAGLGDRELVLADDVSDAEVLSGCDVVMQMLSELSPSRRSSPEIYIYLCRHEAPLAHPIVRLGFHGAIQSPGSIAVTCDSVELVGWIDVHFVELPATRRSD